MLLLWCLSMIQVISLSSWWKKFSSLLYSRSIIVFRQWQNFTLSCVIFHLKPSLRNVAIVVLINDSSYLSFFLVEEVFISSLFPINHCFPLVVEFHLSFEMFSISPLQAYSFRCWFSNNSVITLLEGCLPRSFVAEVVIFFSIPSFHLSIVYFFLPEVVCCDFIKYLLILSRPYSILFFPTGVLPEFGLS